MADTASLVARVKTEGADAGAKQLDQFAASADRADASVNRLTPDVGKANIATQKAANDGFAKFRNGAQQVGFQVQDMVVQLQSGTSAFVAIGQQGSQLAGAFGPGGAVLGAVIALGSAIGGVLYKSLGNAEIGAKELGEAHKALQAVLQQTSSGAYEASDAFEKMALSGATAAELDAKMYEAKQALKTVQDEATQSVIEATKATDDWYYGNAQGAKSAQDLGTQTSQLSGFVSNLASDFGVTTAQASALVPLLADVQKNATPDNIQALATEVSRLNTETNGNNKELVALNATLQNYLGTVRAAQAQEQALSDIRAKATERLREQNAAIIKNAQIATMSARDQAIARAQVEKDAFAKREGVTAADIAAYNAARDKEAQQDVARIDKAEKDKTDRVNKAAANREAYAAKREANEAARQQKAADDFLAQVDRTSGDEIARINATEQQKLAKLEEFKKQGTISAQQYEQAKTDIQLTAEDARQKELDKRQQEAAKKQGQHDQYIADIQALNASELELIDVQQKAKEDKAKEFYDRGIISEQEYQNALVQIAQQANDKRLDSYSKTLSDTTSALKSSLGEGNALYKAAAITETVINTYKAATAAYSALAPIPIIGPALGVAAAAAAVAAGAANVAKIRSAREQGGTLSAGQASTIAERGKPEVIMPASASRVRTAQQMRQIMGENSGKQNASDSVVIVNQTTGRIDQATTERDDEGRLRVIIRETVSGDLQDSNSQISLSRRNTRNQPGFS